MSANPYAPPQAPVADIPVADTSAAPVFYPTSVLKLLLLSFATLGLYHLYWFYQHWKLHKLRTGDDIMPFWRAFFSVFFCFQLFRHIREYDPNSTASSLMAGPLAAAYIVATLLSRLPDPYWLLYFVGFFALAPVQVAANALNAEHAPGQDPNTRFTAWNWVGVAIGAPLLGLMLVGLFFVPE